MKRLFAPVLWVEEVRPGIFLMWAERPEMALEPGQFLMVGCGEGVFLRRPLSVHRATPSRLAFLFQVVGKGTSWLSRRKPGEALDLLGPLGKGFHLDGKAKRVLLVAGGMGVAPLAFLAQRAGEKGLEATLLLGARTKERLYPQELLPPGLKTVIATEDGSFGDRGLATDLLPGLLAKADQVFACGPGEMLRALARMPELKDKPVQVSLELRLGCGFGVCLGCSVPTGNGNRLVCRDGPVFLLDEVNWDGVEL
ncbi:MAG: dihydroorotate dehydrogenase electron transfer subunit [Chloroflexi bacterium]|nr:dihydroorotate dehydrogenase electron transfer subunit [Chloroflexota bacterium]